MADTRLGKIYKELLHFNPDFGNLPPNQKTAFLTRHLPIAELTVQTDEAVSIMTGFTFPPNYYNYEFTYLPNTAE